MRRALATITLFTLALGQTGCATSLARRKWVEVESPNFVVLSDLPERKASELSSDLELFREVVRAKTTAKRFEARIPTRIFVFATRQGADLFRKSRTTLGRFIPGLRCNFVGADATAWSLARPIVYHEYVHFLVRNQGSLNYPIWFDEGFAELLSTVYVKNDSIVLGAAPAHRVVPSRPLPFGEVIRARTTDDWKSADRESFYVQSWALVHYFMLGPGREGEEGFPQRMARYIALSNEKEDAETAFSEAMGFDFDRLDGELTHYLRQPKIPAIVISRANFHPPTERTVRRPQTDEVATRLGWLAVVAGNPQSAAPLFAEALQVNPSDSRAHAGLGELEKQAQQWDGAEAEFRRALALAPDDFENHLDMGEYLMARVQASGENQPELLERAREHFRRAIELAPDVPEGYAMLGATYLSSGEDPTAAIDALEKACSLLPWKTELHLLRAQLYHRAGRDAEARDVLELILRSSRDAKLAAAARALLAETAVTPSSAD